jgi:hypothetical protein
MTKIENIKTIEKMRCPHCLKTEKYEVEYHFKKVFDFKKNENVIKKIYTIPKPDFCEECINLKKCKNCEIIMCDLPHHTGRASTINPNYCTSCINEIIQ